MLIINISETHTNTWLPTWGGVKFVIAQNQTLHN
jgi:hypothetical protein